MSLERTGLDPTTRMGARNGRQVGSDVHFTVFIRVPGPRGDFVDPEPVGLKTIVSTSITLIAPG